MCEILNSDIEIEEIVKAVRKLKNGKSPGVDRVPVEMIKSIIDIIKYDLQNLFNKILEKQCYPDSWGEGLRVVIPKGKDDIRPITIENIFPKIFETILDSRIIHVNELFNKTDIYNGGFLKGSRTSDNVLILTSCIQKQLSLGKKLYVAFVDFKKAFNYVNHNVLIYKLLKHGMSGNFVNLIRDMYTKLKGTVKVNNMLYDTILDSCGTNQCGPLSPSMFRFMLGDLKHYLHSKHGIVIGNHVLVHLLWADDMVLFADSPSGLQEQLDGLFKFCSRFQMIVNELKTKVMIFGNEKDRLQFNFNNKCLEIVSEYQYLGVIINSVKTLRGNLFKEMYTYVSDKAKRSCFSNFNKCKDIGQITPKTLCHLFDVYTLPVLNYASEIWSKDKPIDEIERVQLMYLKYVLGVKSSTCSIAVLGEFGRFPIYLNHFISCLKYWCRLISLNGDSLTKQAYMVLKQIQLSGHQCWTNKIVNILKKYNLSEYWYDEESITDCDLFIRAFKEKVYSSYIEEWKKRLYEFPILRSYVTFKHEFKSEKYLEIIKNRKLRKLYAKFRLSGHNLSIETGRHQYPVIPVEERICPCCTLNVIEDEYHFFTNCMLYHHERVELFSKLILHCGSEMLCDDSYQTFKNLMSCDNEGLFYICMFLKKCTRKRNSILYVENNNVS